MRWLLLLLSAVLPLQWFVVVGGFRLHVLAIFGFVAIAALILRSADWMPVFDIARIFVLANVVMILVWAAVSLYNVLSPRQAVQQGVYLAAFLAAGALVLGGLTEDKPRFVDLMRWASLVTSISLLGALSYSMAKNGVNVPSVFARTIAQADPEILQKELFRSAFGGFGFDAADVKGNIRHEVFGSLLVSMCLSSACVRLSPLTSRAQRIAYVASLVLGSVLIVLSLSRSVMLAAAFWPMLMVLRQVRVGRLTTRVAGAGLALVCVAVLLAATGVLQVLWVRFTQDTSSYQKRDDLMASALEHLTRSMLTGGVATSSASSHNYVVDTWLRGGIFAAGGALVAVVAVVWLFASLALTLHGEPTWMIPVTALLALPMVRFFTAGGGLIPPVSWVALGLAAGFLAYRARVRATQPAPVTLTTSTW